MSARLALMPAILDELLWQDQAFVRASPAKTMKDVRAHGTGTFTP
jgi:hypothetical protein